MLSLASFTFGKYKVDTKRSTIKFTYQVEFKLGIKKTFTDKLILRDVPSRLWEEVPNEVLEPTLQALLLILGINYWSVFPTSNIKIEGFKLTRDQAGFWNSLYLNGLGEFFYKMKIDFHNLIDFPYDSSLSLPLPTRFERPNRSLLLNGAGKDSILSAEILKSSGVSFDFFAFAPTPAHERIGKIVGAKTVRVVRESDSCLNFAKSFLVVSGDYPSVSTFTFIATLLAELQGYNSIVFSNERSADFGNLTYLGLPINHQWCKSSVAEKMINDYIQRFITPDIRTSSLLRKYSELEIVRRFAQYPQYLHQVTSCNNYFWLLPIEQYFLRKGYWCRKCPKCVFLFACFAAYLPKKEVIDMFGGNIFTDIKMLPTLRRILGVEGFKPLDCVGEPEEIILAMHYVSMRKEYEGEPAMKCFKEHFNSNYNLNDLEQKVFSND